MEPTDPDGNGNQTTNPTQPNRFSRAQHGQTDGQRDGRTESGERPA